MTHDVGKLILKLLKEKGKSLRWLGRESGVSNSYLSQLSRGLFIPTPEILIKLAPHLGVEPRTLFERAGWLEKQLAEGELPKGLKAFLESEKCPGDITDEEIKKLAAQEAGRRPTAASWYAETLKKMRSRPLYRIQKTLEDQPLSVQEEIAKYVESQIGTTKQKPGK